jgi:hypothetical protein
MAERGLESKSGASRKCVGDLIVRVGGPLFSPPSPPQLPVREARGEKKGPSGFTVDFGSSGVCLKSGAADSDHSPWKERMAGWPPLLGSGPHLLASPASEWPGGPVCWKLAVSEARQGYSMTFHQRWFEQRLPPGRSGRHPGWGCCITGDRMTYFSFWPFWARRASRRIHGKPGWTGKMLLG